MFVPPEEIFPMLIGSRGDGGTQRLQAGVEERRRLGLRRRGGRMCPEMEKLSPDSQLLSPQFDIGVPAIAPEGDRNLIEVGGEQRTVHLAGVIDVLVSGFLV